MSQNFRLFQVSNLSVRNFRIFLLMYTGSTINTRLRDGKLGKYRPTGEVRRETPATGEMGSGTERRAMTGREWGGDQHGYRREQ